MADNQKTKRQPQKELGFKLAREASTIIGGHDVINWHVLLFNTDTEELVVNEQRLEKDHFTQKRYKLKSTTA